MDNHLTLQTLAFTELNGETFLIIWISIILVLLLKIEFKRIGKFYRMKLGIKE